MDKSSEMGTLKSQIHYVAFGYGLVKKDKGTCTFNLACIVLNKHTIPGIPECISDTHLSKRKCVNFNTAIE